MADRLTQLQDAVNQVSVLRSERWELKLGEFFFLRNLQKRIINLILNVKFFVRILCCCKNPNFLTYALGILLLTQCASYQLNFCKIITDWLIHL